MIPVDDLIRRRAIAIGAMAVNDSSSLHEAAETLMVAAAAMASEARVERKVFLDGCAILFDQALTVGSTPPSPPPVRPEG
jgi:hypothetical protein